MSASSQVLSRAEALAEARAAEMDLILVNPAADPPVCRLEDVSKYVFARRQREKVGTCCFW